MQFPKVSLGSFCTDFGATIHCLTLSQRDVALRRGVHVQSLRMHPRAVKKGSEVPPYLPSQSLRVCGFVYVAICTKACYGFNAIALTQHLRRCDTSLARVVVITERSTRALHTTVFVYDTHNAMYMRCTR